MAYFGGMIGILIAVWIYRTAMEAKTGKTIYWVIGSFIVFLVTQWMMIYFNSIIIEMLDTDIGPQYDANGELADPEFIRENEGGVFGGIIFELLPYVVPFFIIAILRLLVMLKQPLSFMGLFGGIKETLVGIGNSFKTSDAAAEEEETASEETKE